MAMNRRDALKNMVLMMGGTMVGANVILTGCAPEDRIEGLDFSDSEIAYMDEIGEAIIPTTDTPGAKATGIGVFMATMVRETYNKEQQETWIRGLNEIRDGFKKEMGNDFMSGTVEQRTEYLNSLNRKGRDIENEDGPQYINMMKDLTLLGYFTSEIGATQQLRYVETPGRYDGCTDYTVGDKVWAI
ncbi:gluconate 2-dehydrogenase subunit 3 family protein [Anditalea andensis]|uniref:Twin-arginine translocation pathway signal protein n=1 Tax=Anditalea andensis TaxID=1048983 RepID=A0A074LIS9_9BACT|nr:gluconate 2-dehydrogenase subunit 3 family protein [Anditalea andensis]KEO73682.1 twin-arginine translocation pathway signal protein [Anditalea andensis]